MKRAEARQNMYECMRVQRKSKWTIKAYLEWLDKYMVFLLTCQAESHEEKTWTVLDTDRHGGERFGVDTKAGAVRADLFLQAGDAHGNRRYFVFAVATAEEVA